MFKETIMGKSLLEIARERAAQSSAVLTSDSTAEKAAPSDKEPEFPIPTVNPTTTGESKEEKAEVLKHEPYVPAEGDYKALRLNQFYTADGKRVAPNVDGWYHPADEEQAEMLKYYATKHGLVEAFDAE